MQTRIHKFIPFFFSTLFLATGLLLMTSCDSKEEVTPTPIEEVPFPDPIEDLVAYLSSTLGLIMVDPAYQQEVIALLGLYPTTDGRFQFTEINTEGEALSYTFEILPIPIPDLYFAAKEEMELETAPRLVDGVWYRVWRNAECGERIRKKDGLCEELAQVDPQTGAIARQHKIETEHKRCKQGDVLCPEKLLPVGKTYFYDKLCKDDDTPDGNEVGTPEDFKQYRCDY